MITYKYNAINYKCIDYENKKKQHKYPLVCKWLLHKYNT